MKKLLFIIPLVWSLGLQAQSNILNAKTPQEIGRKTPQQIAQDNSKPLPYPYTDDKDVLWSIEVWEKIDLDERFNLPLYYPTDSMFSTSDRKALFDVLLSGIKEGKITEVYADTYFKEKLSYSDIEERITYVDTMDAGIEQYNYEGKVDEQYIRKLRITPAEIEEYRIRGVWYFDSKYGELRYRLIGIAPVAYDLASQANDMEPELVELFWVFFPDARKVLHKFNAYNPRNNARPINFDHMLNARYFTTVIYKTSNEYGDREIREYIHEDALRQLLESQRIKEMIREYEEDQWNY
jgi:gliding motility associated protien GldN